MVSGRVTDATELKCEGAQATAMHDDGDHGGGGDNSGQQSGDDNGDQGDNSGDLAENQGENEQLCTTASLTPGAVVQEAELSVSSAGAIWDKIELNG